MITEKCDEAARNLEEQKDKHVKKKKGEIVTKHIQIGLRRS